MKVQFLEWGKIDLRTYLMYTRGEVANTFPVRVHFENLDFNPIHFEEKGNWIDLKAAEDRKLFKGDSTLISLGLSMMIPKGFEAHLAPRSSTFKKYHILQTNGIGIIDQSYSGTNDIWKMSVLAIEDTVIHKGDRIAQFRFVKSMDSDLFQYNGKLYVGEPIILFIIEDELSSENRGGFGSTGV